MPEYYSGTQALIISIIFTIVDIVFNIFGLALNGNYFTFQNVIHWMNLSSYDFRQNPIDFLAVAIIRFATFFVAI